MEERENDDLAILYPEIYGDTERLEYLLDLADDFQLPLKIVLEVSASLGEELDQTDLLEVLEDISIRQTINGLEYGSELPFV